MQQEIVLPFDVELPPVKVLRAGDLSCVYEAGRLRYIRSGETELIRMIYGAVRDEHWGTLQYTIEDEQLSIQHNAFSVQYTAVYRRETDLYKAHFTITGTPGNSIIFSMKGTALAAFKKNRIGLCVLHPIKECSGQPVNITHPDGTITRSFFPESISPQQPFLQVRQMEWVTADQISVQLGFKGDVFETEDQRNWSDSSYKTYSTPQQIPFPVSVQQSDTMEQEIIVTVKSNAAVKDENPDIIKSEEKIPFPKIGYGRASNQQLLTDTEVEWLQKIPFHHYRVVIVMHENGWRDRLKTVMQEAMRLHTLLELVLFFSAACHEEANQLIALLNETPPPVFSMLLLQKDHPVSPAALLQHLYPLLKKAFPSVQVGYGTDSFFTEVNRQRSAHNNFDFISFHFHPQVHVTDTRTLLENLENQPDLINTATHFSKGKPVFISPVTLKDNNDATGSDPRQYTGLAAGWMLLSLQQLGAAGSITCFEATGPAGLLQVTRDEYNNATGVIVSPLYETLAAIHTFQPNGIIKRYAGDRLLLDGLLLENAAGERLFFKMPDQVSNIKKIT